MGGQRIPVVFGRTGFQQRAQSVESPGAFSRAAQPGPVPLPVVVMAPEHGDLLAARVPQVLSRLSRADLDAIGRIPGQGKVGEKQQQEQKIFF